ncbi:hypothetical protein ACWD4O_42275 [Streptomyces sp. NPDC002623]
MRLGRGGPQLTALPEEAVAGFGNPEARNRAFGGVAGSLCEFVRARLFSGTRRAQRTPSAWCSICLPACVSA